MYTYVDQNWLKRVEEWAIFTTHQEEHCPKIRLERISYGGSSAQQLKWTAVTNFHLGTCKPEKEKNIEFHCKIKKKSKA